MFLLAWLVSRLAGRLAGWLLGWHDRRQQAATIEETGQLANVKRRETMIRVVRGTIAYVAFATAIVLSVGQLAGGVDRLATILGASFLLLLAAFAVQRVLGDLIAGATMLLENWFSVGDTVVLHAGGELQGVVEDVSLRQTKLRALNGEVIHVNNSQIGAVRVLPRGVKRLVVELFVSDLEEGEELAEQIAEIVPDGPTTFIERPRMDIAERLSDELARISIRVTVAPGREWLAEGFLVDLLRERAREDLIVHGPVVLAVDESATRSFARATAGTRWRTPRPLAAPPAVRS